MFCTNPAAFRVDKVSTQSIKPHITKTRCIKKQNPDLFLAHVFVSWEGIHGGFFPFVPDFATIVLSSSQCDKACKMPGIKYSRNGFTRLFRVKCKSSVAILLALDEKRVTYHSSWVLCHLWPRVRSQSKKPQKHVSFCNLVAGVGSAIMDSQVQEGNRQTPQKRPFNRIDHDQS